MRISVKSDFRQVKKMFKELGPGVDRAAARALNDTITTVRKEGAQEIKRKHKALKIGDIKREMKVGKATPHRLNASAETRGKPLPLRNFSPSSKKRGGVTAVIGNKRVLMGSPGRRAFQIPKFGNEYFVRKSASGRRIKRIRGPSLPGVFRASVDKFSAIARHRWVKTFNSRLKFEIEKAMRKARGV
jgi:hypothetical protein